MSDGVLVAVKWIWLILRSNVIKFACIFFFQAEDGIRDRFTWLEFRRVLFRSGSKTGSSDIFGFTMVFRISRSPRPEKAVWIKHLKAGKWGHFLFGEQNRKWQHLWLHHSVPYPEIPPPWEFGENRSITGREIQALPVWRGKQEVTAFWASLWIPHPTKSLSCENGTDQSIQWQENADTSCLASSDVCTFCPSPLLSWKRDHTDT